MDCESSDDDPEAFFEKEVKAVKERALNIKKSISGSGAGYNQVIGIRNFGKREKAGAGSRLRSKTLKCGSLRQDMKRKMTRKVTVDFSDDEEKEDLVDVIAAREWRDTVAQCQKYHD